MNDNIYCYLYKKILSKWKTQFYNKYVTSYKVIENGDCSIILLENYPCENKEQLNARERFYIETIECVNKNIPTRTIKEYYEKNKDMILEQKKQYYEKNKDIILEQNKQYYEKNKDTLLEQQKQYQKQYYDKNKDTITKKNLERYYNNKTLSDAKNIENI